MDGCKEMRLLEERVAVVTGSTKGNGRAMANLFSEQGANVVVIGRDKSEAQSVADDLVRDYKTKPLGLKVDVLSVVEVKDMIDKVRQNYGQIDILVNNAGYPIRDDMWDASFEKIL
jgi:3-oxoacyl-[acyl-carrier protein] reductase